MAQNVGQRNTYQGDAYSVQPLIPQKFAVADLIDIIDPTEVPLLQLLGIGENGKGGGSKAAKFRIGNWPSTRYTWLEDHLAALEDELAADAGSGDTTLTMSNVNIFRVGDILNVQPYEELMRVTAVNGTAVDVTRQFANTPLGTYVTGDVARIIGRAVPEGADSIEDYTTNIGDKWNTTQIFTAEVRVSETQELIQQYGKNGEFAYQLEKTMKKLARMLELSLYHGRRTAGTAGDPVRAFGGLKEFITTNVVNMTNAPIVKSDIDDMVQNIWEQTSELPDLLVCNGWVKRKISAMYEDKIRVPRDDNEIGQTIERIQTDFTTLDIMVDRWCPPGEVYFLKTEYIGIMPMREFTYKDLAVDGDYKKGFVVGEYGFVCKNDAAHGRMINVSTSA